MVLQEYLSVRSIEPRTLENIKELYGLLGNPQQSMVCIQIAGTNAKGSVASMLANILRCAGHQVGLFTSPALLRPNERIVIDGKEIDDELFLSCAEEVSAAEKQLGRTFGGFDRVTACALLAFKQKSVDFAVLETGLGGRLDPVTAIDTKLSIITSISMDHMELLGDTLEQIAYEKCGIMKPGVPVISYPQQPEAEAVIRDHAMQMGCPLRFAKTDHIINWKYTDRGQSFSYKGFDVELSLIGPHQRVNAATVLESVQMLKELGYQISDKAILDGIAQTSWPGRLEEVNGILLDGAHNPDAMKILRLSLSECYPDRQPVVLFSIMRDKDIPKIIEELKQFANEVITVQITDRAVPSDELAHMLKNIGIRAVPAPSTDDGLEMLKASTKDRPDLLPLVAGSLYLVGEIRGKLLGKH